MKPEKILYETQATATGGRDGKVENAQNNFALTLALPKELGGPGGSGTNPEQLFAAGYAACFLGAVKLVARQSRLSISDDVSVTAKVGIGPIPVGYALSVELQVSLPNIDRAFARDIVAQAHQRCPYSNATRGNIDVILTVV
ncbi:organic hydroperoxide resistance protein [Bradyrhizobium sp. CCBAU 53338]|uniref:organic hydroperoxide resistance protein n=1 Tax=Bradyrhizobium sp. CCBAU 53338 TaxID=1325111 RepID=UPI001889CD33|nr:organic hydroperoxide resistance protein [Bradyrhizobium sp. CCBAU 53338]QOZ52495.1 organic hydroperoxide resistance protein [Bradyrhizobium sp. CCBAU 53338]